MTQTPEPIETGLRAWAAGDLDLLETTDASVGPGEPEPSRTAPGSPWKAVW